MAFKKVKENFPILTLNAIPAKGPSALVVQTFQGVYHGQTTKGRSTVWLFDTESGLVGVWDCTSIHDAMSTAKQGNGVLLEYKGTTELETDEETGVIRTYKAVDVSIDDGT